MEFIEDVLKGAAKWSAIAFLVLFCHELISPLFYDKYCESYALVKERERIMDKAEEEYSRLKLEICY